MPNGNGTSSFTRTNYISVVPQPGDFDGDGDVDQEDFGMFQKCLTGESLPQDDTACSPARLDADVDVDQYDTAIFIACYSGPGANAPFNCANP